MRKFILGLLSITALGAIVIPSTINQANMQTSSQITTQK
jgi:hypothetical protein